LNVTDASGNFGLTAHFVERLTREPQVGHLFGHGANLGGFGIGAPPEKRGNLKHWTRDPLGFTKNPDPNAVGRFHESTWATLID